MKLHMKNLDASSKQTVNVWVPWVYTYKFNVFPFFIYKIMTLEETNTKRNSSGLFFPFTSPYYNIELVVCDLRHKHVSIYQIYARYLSYLCQICHKI